MAITKIGTPELFDFSATNTALKLPTGTTAERPGTLAGTANPVAGEWRYNTTLSYVEFYDGANWFQIDTEAVSNAVTFPSENFNVNTYTGNGGTQILDAKFNEAANFNGSSSLITLPSGLNQNNNFSWSFWVNFNSLTDYDTPIALQDTYRNYLDILANGTLHFYDGVSLNSPTGTVTTSTWYNVVITKSSSTGRKMFVNGSEVVSDSSTANSISGSGQNMIGAYNSGTSTSLYFDGKIDQVRFFNTALTDDQAEDCYTDETTTTAATLNFPVGAGCIAAYQLDGDASDLSDNYSGASLNVGYIGFKFTPDLTWIKIRTNFTYDHNLYDTVRGANGGSGALDKVLSSNKAQAQEQGLGDVTIQTNAVKVVETGLGASGNEVNKDGEEFVSWNFKAGGAPTDPNIAGVGVVPTPGSAKIDGADSTTALTGTIAATKISSNTKSGFSIVSYQGNGLQYATVDSGLQTQSNLVIIKNLSSGDAWFVGSTVLSTNHFMELNEPTDAVTNPNLNYTINAKTIEFTSASPHNMFNGSGENYVMYSFQNTNGYQRISSYPGNSSQFGPIVYTTSDGTASGTDGFEPAFVMIKATNFGSNADWVIFDNKRDPDNKRRLFLYANSGADDGNASSLEINFYSNGFQPIGSDGTHNGSGTTYLYLAIAADPYTTTPTVANSFGITLNTSPTTNQSVATTFKPDLTWIKGYNETSGNPMSWGQYDLLRGSGEALQTDNTDAQFDYYYHSPGNNLGMEFSDNGYITPPQVNNNINNSLDDFVSYFWKLGGTQTINNDGTSTSVITANAASGCSAAILNQPDTTARNFGHGLGDIPEMMILKRLESADSWYVYHKDLGNDTRISLDSTNAKVSPTGIWDNKTPTGQVFYLQNQTGGYHVAYFFRSIAGHQQVGSYEGGRPTGVDNVINFGFAPRFVLIKNADYTISGTQWMVFDSARINGEALYANGTGAESDYIGDLTLSSLGLRFGSTNINVNNGGDTYIYLAIA